MTTQQDTKSMAVFCDFENVALGVREARYDRFDIGKVLERLLLKGSIVVKKAYCDWDRYKEFKAPMHGASFELIEIPHLRQSGKNSADIRMVVDALDLCYTKAHVDTFVIVSGDSDFSPLVSKLRENNKTVIGVGVKKSTSDLLVAACDEFIYYDDLVREPKARKPRAAPQKSAPRAVQAEPATAKSAAPALKADAAASRRRRGRKGTEPAAAPAPVAPATPPPASVADDKTQEAMDLVLATVAALLEERGDGDRVWGSMVKQTLKRRKPGFNERYYGFRSFNELLEEARGRGLIELEGDEKSGGYIVREIEE